MNCQRWSDEELGWVCEVTDELVEPSIAANVVIRCPKCGWEQIDNDGFGFLYCDRCTHCTHASATDEVCLICRRPMEEAE